MRKKLGPFSKKPAQKKKTTTGQDRKGKNTKRIKDRNGHEGNQMVKRRTGRRSLIKKERLSDYKISIRAISDA